MLPVALEYPPGIEMVSVCTVPARGGRSCEHIGGYKTIHQNLIPLPLLLLLLLLIPLQSLLLLLLLMLLLLLLLTTATNNNHKHN